MAGQKPPELGGIWESKFCGAGAVFLSFLGSEDPT